jgi:hypothetical protein
MSLLTSVPFATYAEFVLSSRRPVLAARGGGMTLSGTIAVPERGISSALGLPNTIPEC